MLDYSTAPLDTGPAPPSGDDLPALRAILNDTLESWVPRVLPGARTQRGEIVAGSVAGDEGSSLRLSLRGERRGLWIDHATGEGGDAFALIESCLGTDFAGAVKVAREMTGTCAIPPSRAKHFVPQTTTPDASRYIASIMRGCSSALDCVTSYLKGRGILRACPADIRAHYSLAHPFQPSGHFYPAMVGMVRALSGGVNGLHRTYLEECEGLYCKAQLEPPRAMLGACKGGAVRLGGASDYTDLAVCEGIETGLSVYELGLWPGVAPMWACLSTSGLRSIELPAHVTRVVIFADWDSPIDRPGTPTHGQRPGTMAAEALAWRVRSEGRRCEVRYPCAGGDVAMDFNDVLMRSLQP